MLTRDERRFKKADRDNDGIATREEFTAFLHPEEFDYMKDVVVQVESTHQELDDNIFNGICNRASDTALQCHWSAHHFGPNPSILTSA